MSKALPICLVGVLVVIMTSSPLMTSAASQHVAEVRVYVDTMGADNWVAATGKTRVSQFQEEMNSTFFEVNEILKTMESNDLRIQLQIEQVVFIGKNILNTNNGKILNKDSLAQFEAWISPQYSRLNYDLALLFTGANLVKENGSEDSYGYAYIGTVCSAKALGVLEIHGTFMDVLSAAHEIGHILGAQHDGFKDAKNCNSKSEEIMNEVTVKNSRKHFFFSSCSASSIKKTINNLINTNLNCLYTWFTSKHLTGPRYASLMTPDEICKRRFGKGSYIARKAYNSYGDKVCVELSCMTKTVGNMFYWSNAVTPPGLKCGKNKQCIQGRCVQTSEGSSQVSDRCPFGDQPKIEGQFQMTCSQMNYKTCPNWRNICCQTCPGNADDVCRHMEGQRSTMARRAYSSYGDNLCTRLSCLSRTIGTTFYWNYYTPPNGMLCGKSKICRDGKCVTNAVFGDPNMSDLCPNGDQPWLAGNWKKTCTAYTRQNGCDGAGRWRDTCCGSCPAPTPPPTPTPDPGTADEVCRQRQGRDSAMVRRFYASYGDNLCTQLSCLTKTEGTTFHWWYSPAPDGLKCGKNKRCKGGKCVWSSTGDPNMSDRCPYGDQPWLAGSWKMTCKDYVRRNGCHHDDWRQICCSSCP